MKIINPDSYHNSIVQKKYLLQAKSNKCFFKSIQSAGHWTFEMEHVRYMGRKENIYKLIKLIGRAKHPPIYSAILTRIDLEISQVLG